MSIPSKISRWITTQFIITKVLTVEMTPKQVLSREEKKVRNLSLYQHCNLLVFFFIAIDGVCGLCFLVA